MHVIGSGELCEPEPVLPVHGKHDPIAYVYEADHHCPRCTFKRFGADADGWIAGGAVDGEGNPVGVLAPWDEWWKFEGERETLACSDCGDVIDTYDPEEF